MSQKKFSLKKLRTLAFAMIVVAGGSHAVLASPVDYSFSGTLWASDGDVTGSFTYDSGNVTSYSFLLPPSVPNPVSGSSYTLDNSDSAVLNLGTDQFRFYANDTYFTNLDLIFTSSGGVLQFVPGSSGLRQSPNVAGAQADFSALFVGGGASPVGATPLPAALPLFASGLCALGLFGRRRRRKASIAA